MTCPASAFAATGPSSTQVTLRILLDLNQLASPHTVRLATTEKRVVCIETQRGCVFRCSFCFYNKDLSIRNRRFDLERVKREIRFWLERDVQELYLMDPVFNLNAERAKEICRFIAAHNHQRIPVHTEVWPSSSTTSSPR